MTMGPEKWRYFRYTLVAFAFVAGVMIYEQGGFTSIGPVGVGIFLLALTASAFAIYLFVRDVPDDPDDPFKF